MTTATLIILPWPNSLEGKTLEEVKTTIHDGLLDGYLINPNVSVSILEYRPFFVNGQVMKPGSYPYHPGLTVNKAITIAGGFTERASKPICLSPVVTIRKPNRPKPHC